MKSILILHNLLFLTLLFSNLISISSWKKEEFRNCNQTPFCKRARSRKPHHCNITATDVTIKNGDLIAKLINPDEKDSNFLILSLSVYQNGILRLKIDENPDQKIKKRFEVSDVILPEFESKKLWLQRFTKEVINGDLLDSYIVYFFDGYEAVVRIDPFEVFIREKSSGKKVISFHSHELFDFEELRVKKEGDDWEERFRSHTDSRPYGSQSISFDASFYDADFVYGIPEHATSLSLKPTNGPGVEV